MTKTMKNLLGIFCLGLFGLTFAPNAVYAHGEKSLEPFIRMRTIQWYDVRWSQDKLRVNDEVVITGKFHVAEDWPRAVPKPDLTYLNVTSPGPVFIRTERYVNGQATAGSAALKLGGDYDFKIALKARLPGRYHLHPFFNLHDAGPVMGPGHWIEVTGVPAAFTNPVKTLNGDVIDMETYGLANGIGWHAFWFALAAAWLLWWVRRPLFISRYKMLQSGQGDALVTPLDRAIAAAILVVVPLVVFGAQAMTDSQYLNTIPLQTALDQIEPLAPVINTGLVQVKVQRAEYNVLARSMTIVTQIRNASNQPVQIREFASANVRFINLASDLANLDANQGIDDDTLVARQGLSIDSPAPIKAGESRTVRLTGTDALWATQRLDGLIRDPDSRLGGLLFLIDATGNRHIASVSTAVIPKFD
jgi:methane/ammonia monooxygenase subunit B